MQHLTKETIKNLAQGTLPIEEQIEALDHIGQCEICASAYGDAFISEELLTVAPSTVDTLLERIHKLEYKELSASDSVKSKAGRAKRQFYFYVLKVSTAMILSLMLLFTGVFQNSGTLISQSIENVDFSKVEDLNTTIRDISTKLVTINMEDN